MDPTLSCKPAINLKLIHQQLNLKDPGCGSSGDTGNKAFIVTRTYGNVSELRGTARKHGRFVLGENVLLTFYSLLYLPSPSHCCWVTDFL
jgi:hypothetical protein